MGTNRAAATNDGKVFTVQYFFDDVAPFVDNAILQNLDWRPLREWLLNYNAPFNELSKRHRS
ncbi:hypothetical protein HBI56_141910 [Parastagonospora nodorum]|nr:hypothetical protein HBI95_086450 [Parastagonospora nodorum]KAH4387800.1 hypothetical protein HBH99_167570 [Parastagonospora nodorum]KAH4691041.1 hypothetical protein HBH78_081780 [Parastagonospora nodorum]KAH4706021.1 hypothetical protein HBH67_087770 [Parastagonospora nodorum]KAH4774841.1 hypothetical protein HBH63_143410 [Parastagonospora nodorum]